MCAYSLSAHAARYHHEWLHGMIADLPTPLHADGALDLLTFARLCERQVCAGASAVVVGGMVGEGDTLTDDERVILIRTAVGVARGRLHVIAGAGSNCTVRAIELTRLCHDAGADAAMSVTPYYNKPTTDGIAAHFHALLDATLLPIIIHDAPSRCIRTVGDDLLVALAASPHLIGLRDDAGDPARVGRLKAAVPGIRLLTGHDAIALPWLLTGGDGAISALANVAPQLCRGMYVAARKGCPRYATMIADMLVPLAATLSDDRVVSVVKHVLALRGLGSADVRMPRVQLTPDEQSEVKLATDAIWASPDEVVGRAM